MREQAVEYWREMRSCGNNISLSSCVEGLQDRGFPMFCGIRGTGYAMSFFARDLGITPSPVQSRRTSWASGTVTVVVVWLSKLYWPYRSKTFFVSISHTRMQMFHPAGCGFNVRTY